MRSIFGIIFFNLLLVRLFVYILSFFFNNDKYQRIAYKFVQKITFLTKLKKGLRYLKEGLLTERKESMKFMDT